MSAKSEKQKDLKSLEVRAVDKTACEAVRGGLSQTAPVRRGFIRLEGVDGE